MRGCDIAPPHTAGAKAPPTLDLVQVHWSTINGIFQMRATDDVVVPKLCKLLQVWLCCRGTRPAADSAGALWRCSRVRVCVCCVQHRPLPRHGP